MASPISDIKRTGVVLRSRGKEMEVTLLGASACTQPDTQQSWPVTQLVVGGVQVPALLVPAGGEDDGVVWAARSQDGESSIPRRQWCGVQAARRQQTAVEGKRARVVQRDGVCSGEECAEWVGRIGSRQG
jgi:hypothetical protein